MFDVNVRVSPFHDTFCLLHVLGREPHLLIEDEAFVHAAPEREGVAGLTTHSSRIYQPVPDAT